MIWILAILENWVNIFFSLGCFQLNVLFSLVTGTETDTMTYGIIGGAVGVLVIIVLIVILILVCSRRRNKRQGM